MPDDTPAGFNNADQAKPIAGYRKLTDDEIALMNAIKAHEAETASLWARVMDRAMTSEAGRQCSIARTEMEGAFMRLCRAVARPDSPWTDLPAQSR
jgi:hypothetical protein